MAAVTLCRMYESTAPDVGAVVMVMVTSIHHDHASLVLLEYNGLEARIMEPSHPEKTRVSRIEPLKVEGVDNGIFILSRTFSAEEGATCEMRFNKAKHVQNVLRVVAQDMRCTNLQDVYEILHWPTYERLFELRNLDFLVAGLYPIKTELRNALKHRIDRMKYFSWRIQNSRLLQRSIFCQIAAICWAVALVRHLEAFLKINGQLGIDQHLSIQDLIDQAPPGVVKKRGEDRGSIDGLARVSSVLQGGGIALEENRPFTGSIAQTSPPSIPPHFGVLEMNVFSAVEDGEDVEGAEPIPAPFFETCIMNALERSPITCSLVLFESYYNADRNEILRPTAAEAAQFQRDWGANLPSHTMLLTGYGTDENGVEYWEFQNSSGDIGSGDRGFLRFARGTNSIIEYVEFEL